jgi:hypothetical protein
MKPHQRKMLQSLVANISRGIDTVLNGDLVEPQMVYSLLVTPAAKDHRGEYTTEYVSNMEPHSAIKMLRAVADQLEKQHGKEPQVH